jgi:type II secretory pathway component GspD/PulD (secretin)
MAASLAPKVKKLAEELGTVSISIAAQQAPAPARGKRRARRKPKPKPAPLTPAAKATVYLDTDERTNRILMIGLEEQLAVVDELISALDVEQQDLRTLRLYEIQHVGAEEVAEKLGELGITSRGRTSRPRTSRRGKPEKSSKAATTRITGAEEPLAEEPQVVVIETTNSLLVNATAEQHLQVATIISYVDSETLEQAIPYEFYSLENQSPVDVAEVLNKLVQETKQDKTGKIEKVVKKEEEIIIVPDENTFSLIVYASRKNQEWIRTLIEKLDRRRPQVLIDVTLVRVNRSDEFDLDLQLATKFPKLKAGGEMDVVGQVLTPFVGGSREAFSSPLTLIGQGFYSDAHIQALLTAIQTKSYGRVLAKPRILVNDGQSGTIKTTDTTNVKIEQIIIPEEGTQRTTTSFSPYQAGITLTITPNISEGNLLLLEVSMERSDFGETPEVGAPPDTTASNIDTIVTVPNNRTIILGGLSKLNQTKGGSKIPLLGDIPLLGGLFRQTSNSDVESKLYIFVKANILRPDETLAGLPELERISARNRAAFEKFEEKFQKHEDWPGIKPEPMDPLRVLEAE